MFLIVGATKSSERSHFHFFSPSSSFVPQLDGEQKDGGVATMGSLSYRVPLFKLTNGLNKSLLLSLDSRARSVGARVGLPIKFDSSKKSFYWRTIGFSDAESAITSTRAWILWRKRKKRRLSDSDKKDRQSGRERESLVGREKKSESGRERGCEWLREWKRKRDGEYENGER